jgi:hypothetical protein
MANLRPLWLPLALLMGAQPLTPQQEPAAFRVPGHRGAATPVALTHVSPASPWPAACNGTQSGTNYHNGVVEPFVASDPRNPSHLIGVWQQDRWTNGGSSGLMTGVTLDQGRTWSTTYARFSVCTGGIYTRASDPWVAISPNGAAHQIALGLKDNNNTVAVLVSRSTDGGFTWADPNTLVLDAAPSPITSDKESITADPADSHYVYAVWDKLSNNTGTLWFSRTTDGGDTWESSHMIYDPGVNNFATAPQVAVLPDGQVLAMIVLSIRNTTQLAVLRSGDHGLTWSSPKVVATDNTVGTVDARTQKDLRTGAGIPAIAVDHASGAVYIVWSDARFSGMQRDGVALTKSTDGGVTWSAPVQVNRAPNVQAFTPAVAVGDGGTVAVTYFDFRKSVSTPGPLWTNYWRVTSTDGANTWREVSLAGPFDMLSAPQAQAPFLGDYQGLAAAGGIFVSFFAAANTGNTINPSDIFATSLDRRIDMTSTLRTEINLRPHGVEIDRKPQ